MARRNFHFEFRQFCVWSILAGIVEGQFGSVVVAKSFNAGDWTIAIAPATPIAAFTSSLIWGMLCKGRPKVRLLVWFSTGTALLTGLVGLIPSTSWGAWWFIAQMAAAQVLMAGVITIRSSLWKSNYPTEVRGQITAKLQRFRFIISTTTSLVAAAVCDAYPAAYGFIYPIVATCGLLAVWMARSLHVRGEKRVLAVADDSAGARQRPLDQPPIEPFSLVALLSPGKVFGQMFRVLREDKKYRDYCFAQFLMGTANLMTISVIVILVTTKLDLDSSWEFWISTVLLVGLLQLGLFGSLNRWGALFDRVGVLSFRVINVSCWTLSLVAGLFATLAITNADGIGPAHIPWAVGLFALRGFLAGLGRGGGALAWHIGHLHFSESADSDLYMGIHVFLTGVRGLLAPLWGVWLWQNIGAGVWGVAIALSVGSLVLFYAMARNEKAANQAMPATT
ncbi:MAG: hypothetical protein ACPGXK_13110 [Phycisphaerae bacterium]